MSAVFALVPWVLSVCQQWDTVGTWECQLDKRLSHLPESDRHLKDRYVAMGQEALEMNTYFLISFLLDSNPKMQT